jgi:hypothetical protein
VDAAEELLSIIAVVGKPPANYPSRRLSSLTFSTSKPKLPLPLLNGTCALLCYLRWTACWNIEYDDVIVKNGRLETLQPPGAYQGNFYFSKDELIG